jgi:putative transcriptional regulator
MKTKTREKSRILEAVHGTAADLRSAGFISKRRMREYDALCLAPIPRYSRTKIRALRQRHRISQAALATVLNTSLSTVRQWEIGAKQPSGPSLKLLDLLDCTRLSTLLVPLFRQRFEQGEYHWINI